MVRRKTERSPGAASRPAGPPPAGLPSGVEGLLQTLPLLVFLSGASALVYETLWLRSFGLIFGNTTRAVSLVLATFMGGLALGSAVVARLRLRNPIRVYALTELAIGLTALVSLWLLRGLPGWYGSLAVGLGLAGLPGDLVRALLAGAFVLPTTILIGATLPLVVEFLTRVRGRFHAQFGALYRVNTLGAATGVTAAALIGLPAFGVRGTFVIAALVNLGIGLSAWRWSRPLPEPGEPGLPEVAAGLPTLFAVFAVVSGLSSFALEVVWTRSFALVIGSSFYSFSLMLLAFLVGIAGGALVYERTWPRLGDPRRVAGILALAIGLLTLGSLAVIGQLPGLYLGLMRRLPVTFAAHQAAGFGLCLATMLPLTMAFGLLFPALTHFAKADSGSPQRVSGLLYAWNTAGAVAGALLADRLLIPILGLQASFATIAGLPLVLAAWTLVPRGSRARVERPAWVSAAVVLVVLLAWFWRPWDRLVMSAGVYKYGIGWKDDPGAQWDLGAYLAEQREPLFYKEGSEALVSVVSNPRTGRRFIAVNGKTEAGDGSEDVFTQKFIAHVPLILHPDPQRVLVVGWGAGATAGSAGLHRLRQLDCVEIEPATFEAAPFFEAINRRIDLDPRFRFVPDDARSFLLTSAGLYDVILSEPSNPWISGVSNLFTRDFYEIVSERLAPRGLFCQWFHYYNLAAEDVRSQVATFASVFPHATLWLAPPTVGAEGTPHLVGDLLLIGGREPVRIRFDRVEEAFADPAIKADLSSTGAIRDELSFAATWAMGSSELRAFAGSEGEVALNTDDLPSLELNAPRRNVVEPRLAAEQTLAIHQALVDAAGLVPPLDGLASLSAGGPERAAVYRSLADAAWRFARPAAARKLLEGALELDPGSSETHRRLGEMLRDSDAHRAEDHLRRAFELAPGDVRSGEALARILVGSGKLEPAEAVYRLLRAHNPDDATVHAELAAVLIKRGRLEEARDGLTRAVELDPSLQIAVDLLAQVERALSRSLP